MRRTTLGRLAIALLAAALTAATAAAAGQAARMTFGDLTIEGESAQVDLRGRGPWEWEGPVTVRVSGFTMTCDTLKLWPTPDGSDFERVEAAGNVRIEGRYVGEDKTEWKVRGRAKSGSYDTETQQGVLSGAVWFEAENAATGAVLSAVAERLIYDVASKRFRFERGDAPVRMEWREPEAPAEAAGTPAAESQPEKAGEG